MSEYNKPIKTRGDIWDAFYRTGIWRADVTEGREGGFLAITIPKTSPNAEKLTEALTRCLSPNIMFVIIRANDRDWIKNRKKYSHTWRTV